MTATDLIEFVETQINETSQKIIDQKLSARDELSFGKLSFYFAMRRHLNGRKTVQDIGLFDAINDSLQHMGIVAAGSTFLPTQPRR